MGNNCCATTDGDRGDVTWHELGAADSLTEYSRGFGPANLSLREEDLFSGPLRAYHLEGHFIGTHL